MQELNDLTHKIIGAAIEVHRHLGPGLLESTYEHCLARELELQGIPFKAQIPVPVHYKGIDLDCGYRLDMLVDDSIILELKTVERILPIHQAQLLTYLKLKSKKLGLIINFNSAVVKDGVVRMVN